MLAREPDTMDDRPVAVEVIGGELSGAKMYVTGIMDGFHSPPDGKGGDADGEPSVHIFMLTCDLPEED